jgi:adenosine deaminase
VERDERLAILAGLPKIDLHRHLEGSLRLSTMIELGHKQGLDLPLDNLAALTPMVSYMDGEERTLQHFLTKFHCDWYRSYADIERVTTEAVLDAADEGILYLELRFSPEHFTRTSHLDMQGVMEAVTESGRMAAGDTDLQLRFLITFARERYDFDTWKHVVDVAAEMTEEGLVGVDLAGDEFAHPNQQFEKIFRRICDTGVLGVTIHAGEGTHAEQVATAVERLHCKRIGHGIKAAEDPSGDPAVAQAAGGVGDVPHQQLPDRLRRQLGGPPLAATGSTGSVGHHQLR